MSRLARSTDSFAQCAKPPFHNFDFVEEHFAKSAPIRRLFSIARSHKYGTVLVESVPAEAAVADEVDEIEQLFPDYELLDLKRVSFWRSEFSDPSAVIGLPDEDCLGWAIVKHDRATLRGTIIDRWHVFESVMVKYDHPHNYVPGAPRIPIQIGGRKSPLALSGWMYCQQNGLNKCCAHVAIRTIATAFLPDFDLPYSKINRLIPPPSDAPPGWLPRDGLLPFQIEKVLGELGIPFDPVYYPMRPEQERARHTKP